jgi:hypothetical protein
MNDGWSPGFLRFILHHSSFQAAADCDMTFRFEDGGRKSLQVPAQFYRMDERFLEPSLLMARRKHALLKEIRRRLGIESKRTTTLMEIIVARSMQAIGDAWSARERLF